MQIIRGNKAMYFEDVQVGETFVIDTEKSRGALYEKVEDVHGNEFMVELEKGLILEKTHSPVKVIRSEILV